MFLKQCNISYRRKWWLVMLIVLIVYFFGLVIMWLIHTILQSIQRHVSTPPIVIKKRFSPIDGTIFFHETSHRGYLNSRESCAVEAAARANPFWKVYVLFTSRITDNNTNIKLLREFKNVYFSQIHLLEYAIDTPLEDLVMSGRLNRSKWQMSHTSDVLRYLSLYKWGGVYLDLDTVVVKSLSGLTNNWAARESKTNVAAGAMAFSRDEIGRSIANDAIRYLSVMLAGPRLKHQYLVEHKNLCLAKDATFKVTPKSTDLANNFRGDIWGHNGPGVITRVLKKRCITKAVHLMSASSCQGFELYPPELFYPIRWQDAKKYFKPGDIDSTNVYAYHIWNHRTEKYKVRANYLYTKIAMTYCPSVYSLHVDNFGS